MASFRAQAPSGATYAGNEQTGQTGETLGKALQSVTINLCLSRGDPSSWLSFSPDLSKWSSVLVDTGGVCLSDATTTIEW